jgi:hypothetical protein
MITVGTIKKASDNQHDDDIDCKREDNAHITSVIVELLL